MADRRSKPDSDYITGGIQISAVANGTEFIIEPVLGDDVDASRDPTYTVSEVSKTFFGQNDNWLRWQERKYKTGFAQRSDNGYRRYSLSDIERMAFFLAEHGRIGSPELAACLLVIKMQAIMYDYLCWHGRVKAKCFVCRDELVAKAELTSRRPTEKELKAKRNG
jgi:hypothetical protein